MASSSQINRDADADLAIAVALAQDEDDDFQCPAPTQAILLLKSHTISKNPKSQNLAKKPRIKPPPNHKSHQKRTNKRLKTDHSPTTISNSNVGHAPNHTDSGTLLEVTNTQQNKKETQCKDPKKNMVSLFSKDKKCQVSENREVFRKGFSIEDRLLSRNKGCEFGLGKLEYNNGNQKVLNDGKKIDENEAKGEKIDGNEAKGSDLGTQLDALLQLCCSGEDHMEKDHEKNDDEDLGLCSEGEGEDITSLLTQAGVRDEIPEETFLDMFRKDSKDDDGVDLSDASISLSDDEIGVSDKEFCKKGSNIGKSIERDTSSSGITDEKDNESKPCLADDWDCRNAHDGSKDVVGRQEVSVKESPSKSRVEQAEIQEHVGDTFEEQVGIQEDSGKDCVEQLEMDLVVLCPVCELDISSLNEFDRETHTNECLDKEEVPNTMLVHHDIPKNGGTSKTHIDVSPVIKWLDSLGLSRYADVFIKEEIDWDALRCLTENDLLSLGISTLGPRRKLFAALQDLRNGSDKSEPLQVNGRHLVSNRSDSNQNKESGAKLITEFFKGPSGIKKGPGNSHIEVPQEKAKRVEPSNQRKTRAKNHPKAATLTGIPEWLSIPGTPFRVDAFRYLRGDCSHWFLTHFHTDHYQGLTKGFRHGKVYCSLITARLVNMRIGITWDRLHVLPLNERINVDGVYVTFIDANHCPGSVVILFETANGKPVLHTGDFRFCQEMANNPILSTCNIHTLILDTTYCNPQYDFPKQETVVEFVLEAIQAEAFNPRTLFLIGTYTIGKERIFLEVARVLRKKVYVGAAKLRLLTCMGLPEEDMQWLTCNEHESHIHIVPLWSIANFKRMNMISKHYHGQYNTIVAFSPTGWSFGKGKKKTPGKRWQQGTLIRYEVPYSEHSSFTELKEFVKFIAAEHIIPSVNNDSPQAADSMVALLRDDS